MAFYQQLGVEPGITVVIGSGGKTSLLGRLAEEVPGTVILCTTTHIRPFPAYPLLTEPTPEIVRQAPAALPCLTACRTAARPAGVSASGRFSGTGGLRAGGGRRLPTAAPEGPWPPGAGDPHCQPPDHLRGRRLRLRQAHPGGGPPAGAVLHPHRRGGNGPSHAGTGRPGSAGGASVRYRIPEPAGPSGTASGGPELRRSPVSPRHPGVGRQSPLRQHFPFGMTVHGGKPLFCRRPSLFTKTGFFLCTP